MRPENDMAISFIFTIQNDEPLPLHMDSKAIPIAHANGPTKRSKHIDLAHHEEPYLL